jgi:hypothetical protein
MMIFATPAPRVALAVSLELAVSPWACGCAGGDVLPDRGWGTDGPAAG